MLKLFLFVGENEQSKEEPVPDNSRDSHGSHSFYCLPCCSSLCKTKRCQNWIINVERIGIKSFCYDYMKKGEKEDSGDTNKIWIMFTVQDY